MILVIDASTLINLANGEVLTEILQLSEFSFQVSRVVRGESKTIAQAIDAAVKAGHIGLVDDGLISVSQFKQAKASMLLDDGETECILAAEVIGCAVACDDGAARKVISARLGTDRLSGSIGLLRCAVDAGAIDRLHAFSAYRLMRKRGGFLPVLNEGDF